MPLHGPTPAKNGIVYEVIIKKIKIQSILSGKQCMYRLICLYLIYYENIAGRKFLLQTK